MNSFKTLASVAGLAFVLSCASKPIPIPSPIQPNLPRSKIEPSSLKFRIAVFDFVDQTGMAGGVVQTGGVRGLVKSGSFIIAPPEKGAGGGTVTPPASAGGAPQQPPAGAK